MKAKRKTAEQEVDEWYDNLSPDEKKAMHDLGAAITRAVGYAAKESETKK